MTRFYRIQTGLFRKYLFSLDHKVIGLQYALTSLIFLLIGFAVAIVFRWQLAYPGKAVPLVGSLFGELNAPGGVLLPEFYNQLVAMHGTIMVFLAVVPLSVGAFGNYLVPLQIGAPDMAFPRLNMSSYWLYLAGGLVMVASFFAPQGASNSGWTSYPPLADFATMGQTFWLAGMFLLILSSLGSINMITTIVQRRAPGLTWLRLPFFIWAQLVTAFLLLLAFPPLQGAAILQAADRLVGTSFFLPSGLIVSGEIVKRAGGGNPLLWQHLFWFLAHPEVYVLILPAMGIVGEVVANNTRKPLWGYRSNRSFRSDRSGRSNRSFRPNRSFRSKRSLRSKRARSSASSYGGSVVRRFASLQASGGTAGTSRRLECRDRRGCRVAWLRRL